MTTQPNNPTTPIRKTISAVTFYLLLIVVGVASIVSLRWVSPSAHLDVGFGPTHDLTAAVILGTAVVLIAIISHLITTNTGRLRTLFIVELVLTIGLIISTVYANDKRLALNNASGLLVAVILMHAAYRLTDQPWKLRLAVIVLAALGGMFAAKTWSRQLWEFDQTWQDYQHRKTCESFWEKQGKTLDDPTVKLFEARLLSRDNGGFFYHGNLGAAFLATTLFVCLAGVVRRLIDRRQRFHTLWLVLQILLCVFVTSALVVTYSKGAIVAAATAAVIVALLLKFASALKRHLNVAIVVTTVLVLAAFAAVIAFGLIKNTLPTLSMAYRWQYWTAGVDMFADHPLTGVGAGNFGAYYLKYKLPQAEEEVSSPHNFIVQGFTEYGAIGGTALTALIVAIFLTLAKGSRTSPHTKTPPPSRGPASPVCLVVITVGIFGAVFALNPMNLHGFDQLLAVYLPYILTFAACFVISALHSDQLGPIDNTFATGGKLTDSRLVIVLTGALIMFALGNLVNFSLFEPSTQFLFFFLAGVTLAAVRPAGQPTSRPAKLAATATLILALIAYLAYVVIPSVTIESALADTNVDRACRKLTQLTARYRFDAHPPAQAAKRLIDLSQQPSADADKLIQQAAEHLATAAKRADHNAAFYRRQAQCYALLAQRQPTRRVEFLTQAADLFDQALQCAPRSKFLWFTSGMTLWHLAQARDESAPAERKALTDRAKQYLETALQLNDALVPGSLHRFSPSQHRQITDTLAAINTSTTP